MWCVNVDSTILWEYINADSIMLWGCITAYIVILWQYINVDNVMLWGCITADIVILWQYVNIMLWGCITVDIVILWQYINLDSVRVMVETELVLIYKSILRHKILVINTFHKYIQVQLYMWYIIISMALVTYLI